MNSSGPLARPKTGRNNLRLALASLRRQLEPPDVPSGSVLLATRGAIGLDPTTVTTDVAAFESLLGAARGAAEAERARLLTQAVELYHGRLLPGYYESWIPVEEARLESLFVAAQRQLLTYLEQQGDTSAALRLAQRAATLAPIQIEALPSAQRLTLAPDSTQELPTAANATLQTLAKRPPRSAGRLTSVAPNRTGDKTEPGSPPASTQRALAVANPQWPRPATRFFGREAELHSLIELLQGAG